MSLSIEIAPLRKYSLLIATPCYGGQMNMNYHHSCMKLHELLMQAGIAHEFRVLGNESLIPRARNVMAGALLDSTYTHLLFIDGDIEFDPRDVFMLLHFDKEVIGAPYPMKGIDWAQLKEIILKHPDIPVEELPSAGAKWPVHFHEGKQDITPYVPKEIYELATGFMLIKREVFEALKQVAPEYKRGMHEQDLDKRLWDFFPCGVDGDRYESEDYGFCRLWRKTGGKIWLCPWVSLNHWGTYGFQGNLYRALELLNKDEVVWQTQST